MLKNQTWKKSLKMNGKIEVISFIVMLLWKSCIVLITIVYSFANFPSKYLIHMQTCQLQSSSANLRTFCASFAERAHTFDFSCHH